MALLAIFLLVIGASLLSARGSSLSYRLAPVFRVLHTALALVTMAGFVWHIILLPAPSTISRFAAYSATVLWVITAFIRLARIAFCGRATIKKRRDQKDVVHLYVRLHRPIDLKPGNYFYILLPTACLVPNSFYSHPLAAIPCNYSEQGKEGIQDLLFIIDKEKHSRLLNRLKANRSLLLDGPYGSELHSEHYENLILTAQGIGIVGILPVALYIARRKQHNFVMKERIQWLQIELQKVELDLAKKKARGIENLSVEADKVDENRKRFAAAEATPHFRDLTRRIDIIWVLEDNLQVEWVKEQIRDLQDFDQGYV